MKIYAIRNLVTGNFVRLGRAKRYSWNHMPTNVIRHNIPSDERLQYVIDVFDLNRQEPIATYDTNKKKIK